ncbi:MAG: 4-hydroxythreonine-4-phosphate dehydrogenase PdxA [Flavobacteriia bacterium]|nr:MAG: 4-hydroxythreonine-4-phosphate dehydrogenase PdxA [Flavobacteriia bacterium]
MKKIDKIKVGISIGDLNGIGLEVILKTFEDNRVLEFCTPIIFGSTKTVSYHKKVLHLNAPINGIDQISRAIPNKLNLVNIWRESVVIELGKPTDISGEYALKSLESATNALKNEEVDVLVTAPINKYNIQSENFKFQGHTEFLEANLEGESLMILMTDKIRMGLITGHIPVKDVAATITPELIEKKVNIMHKSLIQDFNISKPKIAILGLNPHCGDHGVIGIEDDEIVAPTIKKIQETGKIVYGPYAADSFFGSQLYKDFDGILAMYHDQGLAPFKTLSFGKGVNFTAGLNRIRTSPDHGTAYEIAGKNKADHSSFREALFTALSVYRKRTEYEQLIKNQLKANKR